MADDPFAINKVSTESDTFFEILRYRKNQQTRQVHRLEDLLSSNQKRGVRQIADHPQLRSAFEKLAGITGIRSGMSTGSLHKFMSVRCDEEIVNYLGLIYDIWLHIVGGVESNLVKIDTDTVQFLELKCPGFSARDERDLHSIVASGRAFRNFDQTERKFFWQNLCSLNVVVLSVSTFFKHFRYLEECASCMKSLVSLPRYGSLHDAFRASFKRPTIEDNRYPVQTSDSTLEVRVIEPELQFDAGWCQMWLFAMRHFQNMTTNPSVLPQFAILASRLYFETDKIMVLKSLCPEQNTVLHAESYPDMQRRTSWPVQDADPRSKRSTLQPFVTSDKGPKLNVRPWSTREAYERNKEFLFLDIMNQQPVLKGKSITSVFLLRTIYVAFFRKLSFTSDADSMLSAVSHHRSYDEVEAIATTLLDSHEDNMDDRQQDSRESRTQTTAAESTDAVADHEENQRRVTFKIMKEGILQKEEHLVFDTTVQGNKARVESFVRGLMLSHSRTIPFSPKKYPLLVDECYNEIIQKGSDCIFLVDSSHVDMRNIGW
ncbi:uncharacterized protein BDZ83DRAFT_174459 [Colletotrichum acutatum]|uniref:Uncharacterized protein n=1 Tax=Glomerella acutata TaxID=27357 RepID=A0AAD8UAY2_GLOAC|nr:uncharacterized protein BDZ83DRAFT_174459 [Colletotrichum acutatum]KAK1707766.1 hypothetical protein BDZ83DRAFT_174459 [Colletotrichum acutatum]